jgi:hypothetical protein
MVIAMLILTILAVAFLSAGYSMLQEYLQQHTTSDTEKAQAHLTYTVKSEYKQVSVFCMPVRLPSLVWYQWCVW